MTNQNIQCWQEAPLRPALYHMLLATPVKRLHRASYREAVKDLNSAKLGQTIRHDKWAYPSI